MKLLILLTAMTLSAYGNEATQSANGANPQVGGNRAVTAFDKEEGFQMSQKALKSLKIQFTELKGPSPWTIPKNALVKVKHVVGVYRRFEGWITFVLVNVLKENGNQVTIRSEDLEKNDSIATSGVNFLRMTEVDLNTDTVDGCAN